MAKDFKKTIENFVCEHCGVHVEGSGYTNHCPQCLWSKHVDIYPGDRAATCRGMMKPVRIEQDGSDEIIVHLCESCDHTKRNIISANDDRDIIVSIAKQHATEEIH